MEKPSLTIYHCQPLWHIVCEIRISAFVQKLMQRLKITVVSVKKSNRRPSVYVKVVQILNVTFVFIFLRIVEWHWRHPLGTWKLQTNVNLRTENKRQISTILLSFLSFTFYSDKEDVLQAAVCYINLFCLCQKLRWFVFWFLSIIEQRLYYVQKVSFFTLWKDILKVIYLRQPLHFPDIRNYLVIASDVYAICPDIVCATIYPVLYLGVSKIMIGW